MPSARSSALISLSGVFNNMRLPLFRLLETVRTSYWFLPSVMAILAIALGVLMVWLDAGPGTGWMNDLGWYQKAKPDGAHQVLSTIAGSMITVAGVVFSITIVAIAYASSQYGPRILTNFMSDRGNQVTLGTFIATFVYCLVVLRTIRGGDAEAEFVPQMAVMVGLLLALCSIAVFIYFIHHVPQSIHINNVVAHIGRRLIADVGRRFPEVTGSYAAQDRVLAGDPPQIIGSALAIRSASTGYIQALDEKSLMKVACNNGVVVRLHHRTGDFIHKGRVIANAWPQQRTTASIAKDIIACYSIGSGRTPHGDLNFLVDELVEIAARALSSGINDPFTAMTCLDWLGAGASDLATRAMPSSQRVDSLGVVRVLALPDDFNAFIERGFGGMRQYVARDMKTAAHALLTIATVAKSCCYAEAINALAREVRKLTSLYRSELKGAALQRVEEQAQVTQETLSECLAQEDRLP